MRHLAWCWLACWALCGGLAQAEVKELREARAVVTIDGQPVSGTVSLPYHWDRLHPGKAGTASFEIEFTIPTLPPVSAPAEYPVSPATSAAAYALYIPRLGNAYEVWLNGGLLDQNGNMLRYNGSDFAKTPRLIPVASDLLKQRNVLHIHVRTDIGRRGGLAAPVFGTDAEVRPLFQQDHVWRVTGTLVVLVLGLMVGTVALALWFTQTDPTAGYRTVRDPMYLMGGLAELFWTLRISDTLIDNPPLPWPWWGVVTVLAAGGWLACMGSFCVLIAGWSRHRPAIWFNRINWTLFALGVPMASLALAYSSPRLLTIWYGGYALAFVPFVCFFAWRAFHRASPSHKVVALALLVNVAVGVRDWFTFRISTAYAENTLLRYSSVLFGLALGYIVITRFREVTAQARDLMANLSSRIAQKEAELGQSYLKVEQLAREQERVSERTRILRDMHDGVGAHLSAAIRQLQSGKASTDDVLQTLRYTLDQLKLSIDAMHLIPGDIASLLANLRYRLEPRFAASDIELLWVVGALEPVAHVDANAMRQIQFMVFEALSNVLQHSHATTLAIEADMAGAGIHLRIVDNGRGFDAAAPPRKGLLSMRERATAIGVAVAITSQPGRTVVEIRIP
ncbi:MAG: sensor histidine kinase [Polaromonas sp.]|nr:sensor histidine kinase [Polaromonas sp.]